MNPATVSPARHLWEQAEIERSASEARHTPDERLRAREANVGRYLNPPRDSAFPLEYVFSLVGDVRGKIVLDFGCGSGENTFLLVRRGARVIGIDISAGLIERAERRLAINGVAGAARFIVGSCHDLPIETGSIDLVVGIAILHHLDVSAASREIHRVLKPGGRVIVQEPVRDSRLIRAVRRAIPYRAPDVSPFERPLTSSELDLFSAPFRSRSMRAFLLPFVSVMSVVRARRSFSDAAYRWDRAIIARAPWLRRYAGIRVVELTK